MSRLILHFDLDAFYCAVEANLNLALHDVPFVVGGSIDARGVVASSSYRARLYGVRSAMSMVEARRLCPGLVVVSARHGVYGDWSRRVMDVLYSVTPFVEQLSIDEAFLDVSGFHTSLFDIAFGIQMTIRNELGLPCSLGAASNKLVAKIANNIGKARSQNGQPPCAIEVVPPDEEARYLAPLPVRELWGVGPKTAETLYALNIETIGDIARQREQFMLHHFGKVGYDLWQRAQGIDHRPIETEHDTKSISNETTFAQDVRDKDELRRVLRNLAEKVARRLRDQNLNGRTIQIKLRWSDFTTLTRQTTLTHAVQDDLIIAREALHLLENNWSGQAVRLLGVGVSNLEDHAQQLSLWETEKDKKSRQLQRTLDELKQRFGDDAIQRGSNLNPDDD
ncbi:MAG: DNA polymerase IV [Anaerolineae bacterium]